MKIRKAVNSDAQEIAIVHVDSWRTTYKGIVPDAYLEKLSYQERTELWKSNLHEETVYVAENDNGDIVGFATGGKKKTLNYEQYDGELYAIYILEPFQGIGIGKLLIEPVIHDLKESGIDSMIVLVLNDNPAKYFYEALGARKIDTIKVTIAGVELKECVYGWKNLKNT
ncbi:GNAT family N-acetyltransferase [Oceanobacillus massiliensis]|uniref:GNAT family N-acetyltransferase n=1 Tax=Oceanobacillus massiliensis TaxID=1465765 RepID=UPI000317BC91|nr:GNAT family N-acetyltransferase [Oceanobacillus massiliensis]